MHRTLGWLFDGSHGQIDFEKPYVKHFEKNKNENGMAMKKVKFIIIYF